jgi:hypothetical protein
MDFQLADRSATPPTPSSYWVLPSRLLAGAYPGCQHPAEHQARVQTLIAAGIRLFINLMELALRSQCTEIFDATRNHIRDRHSKSVSVGLQKRNFVNL